MTAPTRVIRPSRKPIPSKETAAAYDSAWQVEASAGPVWTARPWVNPTQRAEEGKAARKRVPRASHAAFEPARGRDPIAILAAQEEDRLPELLPLRHDRMAEAAFPYYRGTPAVMAFDLSGTPRTDIIVQACGDAHLSQLRAVRFARAGARLRHERLRRDAARAVGVGRQAAGGEHGHRRAVQRLQRPAEPRGDDGRRCAVTASGWPATPACVCSTSGTPRSPTPTSARRPRRPALLDGSMSAAGRRRRSSRSSARLVAATACARSSR